MGRAAVLALAAAGAHVVGLARMQGALEELDDEIRAAGGAATFVPLDLRDFDALDRLGAVIAARWGRLDVLIGNAGILGDLSPLTHLDPAVWDAVMAVNVTANWRLIRSLDPLLRASDAGRAVFVTSGAAHKCTAYWGAYAVSKAALEVLARTYAAETATTPVRIMLVNPGPLRNPDARGRHAGRGSGNVAHARRPGSASPAPRLAGVAGDRPDLRLPAGPGARAAGAGLSISPNPAPPRTGTRHAARSRR